MEKMIPLIYLIILVCVFKLSGSFPAEFSLSSPEYRNIESVYQKLELMEKMIKSVKEKISPSITASLPQDCEDLMNYGERNSGVYLVWPKNRIASGPISVYCDMEIDGGGWMVIQRRGNFSRKNDYFFQDWKAYKEGFGNLKEDFWLVNDNIYALTNQRHYSIRFDLGDFDGNKVHAIYNSFWIDDENNNYTLHVKGYSGNAGDSFSFHDQRKFSTKDRDNDDDGRNCAETYKGAWWFNDCYLSHLNGIYHDDKPEKKVDGVDWIKWKGRYENLATSEMKIRKIPSWIK